MAFALFVMCSTCATKAFAHFGMCSTHATKAFAFFVMCSTCATMFCSVHWIIKPCPARLLTKQSHCVLNFQDLPAATNELYMYKGVSLFELSAFLFLFSTPPSHLLTHLSLWLILCVSVPWPPLLCNLPHCVLQSAKHERSPHLLIPCRKFSSFAWVQMLQQSQKFAYWVCRCA